VILNKLKDLAEKIFDEFYLNRGQVYAIGGIVVILVLGSWILYLRNKPVTEIKKITEVEESSDAEAEKTKQIYVHVCGAVKNADVYEFKEGDRTKDAVAKAGGTTDEANLDALNLAAKLIDGQKIYVPKVGEDISSEVIGTSSTGDLVNLNGATCEQLEELPGIGEVIAQRIVDYRQEHGSFKSADELMKVEGIGPKKFESIKDKVVVN